MDKSTVGEAYMQEIQEFFSLTLLDTLANPIGTFRVVAHYKTPI
jgi:hypothetical protein